MNQEENKFEEIVTNSFEKRLADLASLLQQINAGLSEKSEQFQKALEEFNVLQMELADSGGRIPGANEKLQEIMKQLHACTNTIKGLSNESEIVEDKSWGLRDKMLPPDTENPEDLGKN